MLLINCSILDGLINIAELLLGYLILIVIDWMVFIFI